jgi:uncharacterized protein with NRDE domain
LLSALDSAPDASLPNTGVGIAWERRLASALITGEDYGTRASTVLVVSAQGEAALEERTRAADGAVAGHVAHRFALVPEAVEE